VLLGANAGLKNKSSKTPDGVLSTLSIVAHRSVKAELMVKLRKYAKEYDAKSTTTATSAVSTANTATIIPANSTLAACNSTNSTNVAQAQACKVVTTKADKKIHSKANAIQGTQV
jgi:hypothetical protein